MKIMLLCYEKITGSNGGIRQVLELAVNFKKLGHAVCIVTPGIAKRKNFPIPILYIPVINLPFVRYISYLFFSWVFLPLFLIRFKPDCVLYFMIHLNTAPLVYLKKFHIPYVLYVNGILREERSLSLCSERYLFPLLEKIYTKSLTSADSVLVVTTGLKDHIAQRYTIHPKKIFIVKGAVDIDSLYPMDKTLCRTTLGIQDSSYIIGFHGSIFPWHGLDYLVETAPHIIKEISSVIFLIIGDSALIPVLKNAIHAKNLSSYFIFTGSMPFEKIPVCINCFDIGINFFKPVRTDPGNPIKMYEYMACEIPVIASNVPGYGDFIEQIGAGISVNPSDSSTTAQQIVRLLLDVDARKLMGASGRKEVIKHHTWHHRAQTITDVLQRALYE